MINGVSENKLKELEQYFDGYGSRHDTTILRLVKHYRRQKQAIELMKIIPKDVHSCEQHMGYIMGILSKLELGRDLK